MGEFTVLHVEGHFYSTYPEGRPEPGPLIVDEGKGSPYRKVGDLLQPFLNKTIRLAFHHLPTFDGGTGKFIYCTNPECPEHPPGAFLNVSAEGVLLQTDKGYYVIKGFDGKEEPLPLQALSGHLGRLAAATVADIERMREIVVATGADKLIEGR